MLTEERQKYIINTLKAVDVIKIQDIMAATQASESTCRRDLQELAEAGYLTRIHGGAKRIFALQEEGNQLEKASKNVQEKSKIGALATTFLQPNDVIFMDAGTTTQAMITHLEPSSNLTVVTNGVDNATLLANREIKTILLGGSLKNTTRAVVGASATLGLLDYRFNKVFLGTNGIHSTAGFTTPDPEEATIKRLAIQHSEQSYILADDSKFDQISFANFASLSEVTVITASLSEAHAAHYNSQMKIKEAKN